MNAKTNSVKKKISAKNLDLQPLVKEMLTQMGEDVTRPGLKDTPKRFEKTMKYLLGGYDRSFKEESSTFENAIKFDDIIALKNIDFFSLCEHHLLPFFGYAHVAYIPSKEAYLGISKLARAVDIYSRRLQDQERMGFQIAEALMTEAKAQGVAVLIESKHLCVAARGAEKRMNSMATCAFYGVFKTDKHLQQQFLEVVKNRETL